MADNPKEKDPVLDAALEAIDQLTAQVKELTDKVNNPVNSVTVQAAPKLKPVVDPGAITVGKAKYKFANLKFRIAQNDELVTYTAEQVAADPKLCEQLAKDHPSIFIKIED